MAHGPLPRCTLNIRSRSKRREQIIIIGQCILRTRSGPSKQLTSPIYVEIWGGVGVGSRGGVEVGGWWVLGREVGGEGVKVEIKVKGELVGALVEGGIGLCLGVPGGDGGVVVVEEVGYGVVVEVVGWGGFGFFGEGVGGIVCVVGGAGVVEDGGWVDCAGVSFGWCALLLLLGWTG